MATVPEITLLFAQLAANLRRSNTASTNSGDVDTSQAISYLTASLNSETPNSRVLDAALSLMCFKTPQVFSARIECLARTVISVLSSMVSCEVSPFELISVGSSMPDKDCNELIRIGADVLDNMGRDSGLSYNLLYALLRATVSSSRCQMFPPSSPILVEENERTDIERRTAVKKLMCFFPDEVCARSDRIPLRLFLWYLDPLLLKHDMSEILGEITRRPFLRLKEELYARTSWRSIVLCLVTSPTIFVEARALLHSWFLLTGLDSVLNLQTALISSVLDVLSRPMWWGVTMEVGQKFPFSNAYFPNEYQQLIPILTGPISSENFLDLVHHIRTAVTPASKFSTQNAFHASHDNFWHGSKNNAEEHNSIWSMLMGFPAWLYFALMLVFLPHDIEVSCLSKAIHIPVEANTENFNDLHKGAAFYLSWILYPLGETCVDLLADFIQKASKSWNMKIGLSWKKEKELYSCPDSHGKARYSCSKKLRVSKAKDSEKLLFPERKECASAIREWLKEFDEFFNNVFSRTINGKVTTVASDKKDGGMQPVVLLLRIPLGILLTSNCLDEKGCEQLLHYASTGEIIQLKEVLTQGSLRQDLPFNSGKNPRIQALHGACLVFNLFDALEDISVRLFFCEETRDSFVNQMKCKVNSYLLSCVKTLIELTDEQLQTKNRESPMVDLYMRLTKWIENGWEGFEGCMAFREVIADFARRLSVVKTD